MAFVALDLRIISVDGGGHNFRATYKILITVFNLTVEIVVGTI